MATNENVMTEYEVALREICERYPEYRVNPIECLNLIMRKEQALDILRGKKKVELRSYSQHYTKRLTDQHLADLMYENQDDELLMENGSYIRPVVKIHFHNYNNTWFLDVLCTDNEICKADDEWAEYFKAECGFTEIEELNEQRKRSKDPDMYPLFYYFELGEVVDTNLTL